MTIPWEQIIELAVKAPSADNLQPWKFSINKNESSCELWLDRAFLGHYCDVADIAPLISAGAVIENLECAFKNAQFQTQIRLFPKDNEADCVAKINVHAAGNQNIRPYEQNEILLKRETNRKFYNKKPIGSDALDQIRTLFKESGDEVGFGFMDRKNPQYTKLAEVVGRGDQLRFEIRKLHEEFMNIIRFNVRQDDLAGDGLDLKTLESGPMAEPVFKLISSWNRISFLNKWGLSRLFNKYAVKQMLSSSGAGTLYVQSPTRENFVKGGQIMQRLWHLLTVLGISIQPMEGIPIFMLDETYNQSQVMNADQRLKIKTMRKELLAYTEVPEGAEIILFFRAGYAAPASALSKRRLTGSFIEYEHRNAEV